MLGAYGVRFGSFEAGPELVHYDNVTELGRPRGTACREGVGQDDRYTVCLTEAGPNMSLIVKGSKGTRFATLHAAREGDYWGDKFGVTTQATFDAEGPKFTPHVCIACHGGRYDPATGLVQGATLLPIDPGLVDLGANRAQLEEPLRQINAQILMSAPSPAVAKYINGMYGGRAMAPGATAAANYVPPGWASEANFYLGIVKKNCAMCHLATPASLNFLSVGNFLQHKDLIYASTCQAHSMPHAEVPFQRFWTEDTGPLFAPGLLAARLGYPSCQ